MKHPFLSRPWVSCLGLLTTLLASPTAGFSTSTSQALGATAAGQRPPTGASVKTGRSHPIAVRLNPAHGLTAPPALPPSARPVAVLPPLAPAQPQLVTLRGVVSRATGQPCAGASVYEARAPRQVVVTDAQGAFALPVVAGATTLLRVEYFGEGSSRVEVPVPTANLLHITLGQ